MIVLLPLLLAAQVAVSPQLHSAPPSAMQPSADSIAAHLASHPKHKVAQKASTKTKGATKVSSPAQPAGAATPSAQSPAPTAIQKRTPTPVLSKIKKR